MAAVLRLILSAPALSIIRISSTARKPPPTVSGMKHSFAVRSITSTIEARPCGLANIAEFATLGFAELDSARDLSVVYIQTRYDAFGQHEAGTIPQLRDRIQ